MNDTHILGWRVHAKTRAFKQKVRESIEITTEALFDSDVRFCIMWSGGKDSTAMTHIVKSLLPTCPIVSQFDDCDWPEKSPYMERVAAEQGWTIHRVEPEFSVWERTKMFQIGDEDLCKKSHPLTREAFLDVLHEEQEKLGCSGAFIGLRSQESPGRRKNFQARGHIYQLNNGKWHCCPLSSWTSQDVFAYLSAVDIEINPCYFKNAIWEPEEIRLSWALPTIWWKGQDIEHLRRYYPEQFRRLRERGTQ
jgi:3'-phosphoadenosine 5'-phosphosulfate sulfotransferase (PAPS reductase)/FAD synthetase